MATPTSWSRTTGTTCSNHTTATPLHGRDREGGRGHEGASAEGQRVLAGLRQRWAPGSVRHALLPVESRAEQRHVLRPPEPGYRIYCDPDVFQPLPNVLFKNNGDGTFSDVSEQWGLSQSLGKGMGVATADYNGDGRMDVFVTNDKTPHFLYRTTATVSARWRSPPGSRQRHGGHGPRAWAVTSRTSTTTAGPTSS